MRCESAWHMVRAKCTDCGAAADLDYLSFDTTEAGFNPFALPA
ncbi:formate dehydrogenase accessory protein FdhE [Cupriavidus sp. amp6]|nr:formate dehydrogenase accessory protein FdhE [Cupriavidus sp. amp6]